MAEPPSESSQSAARNADGVLSVAVGILALPLAITTPLLPLLPLSVIMCAAALLLGFFSWRRLRGKARHGVRWGIAGLIIGGTSIGIVFAWLIVAAITSLTR